MGSLEIGFPRHWIIKRLGFLDISLEIGFPCAAHTMRSLKHAERASCALALRIVPHAQCAACTVRTMHSAHHAQCAPRTAHTGPWRALCARASCTAVTFPMRVLHFAQRALCAARIGATFTLHNPHYAQCAHTMRSARTLCAHYAQFDKQKIHLIKNAPYNFTFSSPTLKWWDEVDM